MTPEVRDVLRKVRDEVLTGPERWGQAIRSDNAPGCICLALAIGDVTQEWTSGNRFRAAHRALGFTKITDVFAWNDASERTFEDVRALLDKALAEETT